MDLMISEAARAELPAAYLQLFVTLGLALLCAILHAQYRKPYFALWAAAWLLYATRIGSIVMLVQTGVSWWLFWHQVVTGWTAIALLWAALVFSQRTAWRTWYWLAVAVPLVWSYVAIYMLESFFWAAGPMVVFLSLTTGWTAWAFLRYDRLVGLRRRAFS